MRVLSSIASALSEVLLPDETVLRNRARITLDLLLTLVVTLLAIGLTVGYQVLGRWGHRLFGDDS